MEVSKLEDIPVLTTVRFSNGHVLVGHWFCDQPWHEVSEDLISAMSLGIDLPLRINSCNVMMTYFLTIAM